MSSWKTYGGIHNSENSGKISADSITVNKLVLQKPYGGIFDICGGLNVSGNTNTINIIVNNDSFLNGNVTIGTDSNKILTINSRTNFIGPVVFQGDSETTGNIVSLESLIAHRNVYIGNDIYFGNSALPPIQSIYYDVSGIGINQIAPKAALDISSNQPYSIIVTSSSKTNESVIAQNCSGQAITMGVDFSNAHIRFYHDVPFALGNTSVADGYINYFGNGTMNIDVSNNVNISSQMTVSPFYNTNDHINGESMTIYDISSGSYYPKIYGNSQANTGSALTLVASDLSSNTFMNISTPNGKGIMIGGGAYAGDASRASGIIGLTGNANHSFVNPVQTIVSGNSTVKYFSTTGINTFQPRTEQYVLDVNGPIHVDNGDVTSVVQTPFQIYQFSLARNFRNIGIAVGSSIDLSANKATYLRERIIKTVDSGQTWSSIDISYTFLNDCDYFTSIHVVDSSSVFITGNANTMIYSGDCGNNWKTVSGLTTTSSALNHIYINPVPKVGGNLYGYYAIDSSSTLVTFEYDVSNTKLYLTGNSIVPNTQNYISQINYIQASSNTIYLAGNAIVKYNATTSSSISDISYVSSHVYSGYTYDQLKIFDNSYVIAVGNNVISSTTNGGITWRDISFNLLYGNRGVHFRSVHMADASNAIAVGWYGNIWISGNQGTSWNPIPSNLINTSGKSAILNSNFNMFEGVTMPDMNTVLLVNTIQPYSIGLSQNGISNIYNVFTPNWLNRSSNIVMDISGTVNVSGDLKISDAGSLVSTNSSMNIFNNTVQSIQLGGDATQITIGNIISSGNTTIRTNVLMNQNATMTSGNSLFSIAGRMNVAGNATIGGNVVINQTTTINGNTILNGNLVVNQPTSLNALVNVNNSNIVLNTGNILVGNVLPIGQALTIGGANNDIYIGGVYNTNRSQSIYIGQSDPFGGSLTNPSTIYIGGANDSVILQGNTTILNIQQSIVDGPTIIVNAPPAGLGANVTSGGAGLDIFDNSFAYPAPVNNVYGYVHVGKDMQSFIFKTPSYGAYTDPVQKTGPLSNTYANIQLISPENRVRLGVNELTLSGLSSVKRGLVILQSNADFKNYQAARGHQYSYGDDDADYAINLCPDFDISNILLKNFDSVVGSQTIGSNLVIGTVSTPASLSVYGNTITYGNLISYGNAIFTTMTFPNGNLYIPSGNMGIGTISPQYPLDISGTARVLGPLISTNYDGSRFPANYGNVWSDTGNTASAGSYFQDVAMSYDGKYQYGLLYNKTGVGSVNVSTNYGSSWTSVSLPSSSSGNIIYQAVPYFTNSNNIQNFTFSQLNSGTWLPSAQPLNIQVGTYIASGSSAASGNDFWNGFSSTPGTYWASTLASYSGTTGEYSGGITTINSSTVTTPTYAAGEYIQIQLPYSFLLTSFQMSPYTGETGGFPKKIYVFGSNNGSTWFLLLSDGNTFTSNSGQQTASIANNTYSYSYYRFVIGSNFNATNVAISSINLSGIVQNTTGAYSYSMAASGTGQIVLIANQGYITGNGNLYLSNNYGQSFADTGLKSLNGFWQGVAISQTGTYQAAIGINRSGSSNIWLSTNSGSTWTSSIGVPNGWQSVTMNSTGQYVTAIQSGNVSVPAGNIWVSSTYGTSWSSYSNIYQYSTSVNSFANESNADFNKTVHISASGRFQTALGLGLSTDTYKGNANIWTNSNYGIGPWSDSGTSAPAISGNVSILSSITMTGGGQHQIASYITNVVGGNSVSGSYLKSVDYGATWAPGGFAPPRELANGTVYRGFFPKIETSANGQYLVGVAKYQDVSGNTYNNNNSTATGVGNIFSSTVTVTNSLLQSKYMGSSYSGNVNQTHGLTVSVPHMSNAAIMMGYDVAWDSAYINSADEYSQNALSLNVNGGPVGIGKINPGSYTLDVSGNVNIDGGLTIGGITNFASSVSFTSLSVNSNTNDFSTIVVSDSTNAGGNKLNLIGSLSNGVKNPIAKVSDVGVMYTASGAGGIVIAPVNTIASGLRVSSSGNVGIGTSMVDSSYAYPLQVQGPSGTLLKLVNNTTGYSSGQSNIEFWDNSANYNLAKISAIDLLTSSTQGNTMSALALSVGYNSTVVEGMRIVGNLNANGGTTAFVGIGTTVPSYSLDVSGGDIRVASYRNTNVGTVRLGSSGVGGTQAAYIQSGTADMVILNQQPGNLVLGTNNGNIVTISTGLTSFYGNANISGNAFIVSSTSSDNSTSGSLVVTGGVGIGGNINIAGNAAVVSGTSATSVTSGALQVIGGVGISENTYIGGNAFILSKSQASSYTTGALQVSGGAGINGNVYALGNIYSGGYITVGGATMNISSQFLSTSDSQSSTSYNNLYFNTITRSVDVGTAVVVNGGIAIGKSATVIGNLYIGGSKTGASYFNSSLQATSSKSGALSLYSGGLYVGQNIIADSETDASPSPTKSGAVIISNGGLYVNKSIYAGGNITTSTSSTITGGDIVGASAALTSTSNITVPLTVTGANVQDADLFVINTSASNVFKVNSTGGVTLTQGLSIGTGSGATAGQINASGSITGVGLAAGTGTITGSGLVTLTNTTNATSTSAGALVVSGGIAAAIDIWIGGKITAATSTNTINGIVIANQAVSNVTTLNASGLITGVGLAAGTGNITGSGAVTFTNTTATTGSATGALIVSGGISTNGNIYIGGKILGPSSIDVTPQIKFTNTTDSTSYSSGAVTISGGLGIGGNLWVKNQTNSGTFNATSDYRLKTNVQSLTEDITVDRLIPCEYDMSGGLHQMGFIAHEVQEVFPFLVSGEKDGEAMQTINYNGFIALLVKEIQELKRENIEIKKRLAALEKSNK